MKNPDVSVVITVLDEEGSLDELYRRLAAALEGADWEAIFVDDGSTDGSFDRLKAFHLNDSKRPLGSRVDRHEHIGEGFLEIALVVSSLFFISGRELFPIIGATAGILGTVVAVTGLMI